MARMKLVAIPLIAVLLLLSPELMAQEKAQSTASRGPEVVVRELYGLVTFPPGITPDWDRVRSSFLPQAVIVLRTSRDSTTVFDVDGFVQDFVTFIENSPAKQSGFEEKVLVLKSLELGDIARVTVLYQAHIPGSTRPPQKGVDVFLLNRRNAEWKIASVVNEIPTPTRPIPEELLEE